MKYDFSDIEKFLYFVAGALVVFIVVVCWGLIWGSKKVRSAKPFDPKWERRRDK